MRETRVKGVVPPSSALVLRADRIMLVIMVTKRIRQFLQSMGNTIQKQIVMGYGFLVQGFITHLSLAVTVFNSVSGQTRLPRAHGTT
jgi:large-conductance mechanosensitive channel